MLKNLAIQNFRHFQDLQIQSLNRVNLFVGRNNSGKTSLLEALFLLFDHELNLEKLSSIFHSIFHNLPNDSIDESDHFWEWLHHSRDTDQEVKITGSSAEHDYTVSLNRTAHTIQHRSEPSPQNRATTATVLSTVSTFEEATRFNHVAIEQAYHQQLIIYLQKIEPRLQDLQCLKLGTRPLIYADIGKLVPMIQMGQGFRRLLQIFSEVIISESNILLIDEIERCLDHKAQMVLWQGLAHLLQEKDIQIFATTHSYECVQAAYEAHSEIKSSNFTLHRLERRNDGNSHVVTYSPTTLKTALELNLEVR